MHGIGWLYQGKYIYIYNGGHKMEGTLEMGEYSTHELIQIKICLMFYKYVIISDIATRGGYWSIGECFLKSEPQSQRSNYKIATERPM